jgi:hypothetical protein
VIKIECQSAACADPEAGATGLANEFRLVTVAVSTSSAAPSTTTTAASATTILAGTCLIDGEGASLKVLTVERIDCRLRPIGHFDETETARFAGLTVHNDLRRSDCAVLAEQFAKVVGSRFKRQISNVQILTHCHPL